MTTFLFNWIIGFRNILRISLDKGFLFFLKPGLIPRSKLKRIGILHPDGLGDLILFLDALRGYRERFDKSEYEIYLIVEECLADFARDLLKIHPYADHVMVLSFKFRKNFFYRYKKLKEIKSIGFDVFINASISRSLTCGDILTFASGACFRFGFNAPPNQVAEKAIGDRFYTHLVSDPKWQTHELERNARLVVAVGNKGFQYKRPFLESFINKEKENYFIVAPGASSPVRRWPISNFVQLIIKIYSEFKLIPLIVGGKEDLYLGDEMTASAPQLPWRNMIGKTSLIELTRVISRGRFTIANDSGPMHLSMAVGVQTVAIVAGGEFTAYPAYPKDLLENILIIHDVKTDCFNCKWECIYEAGKNEIKPCLKNITVEQVYQKIIPFITS
jgi:ADP-heptose:LPS heptosyltransferase